jgi:hydroxylamine reductase
MFCYQCEQTMKSESGAGCTSVRGNCGKTAETSDLQDLLVHGIKSLAWYARRCRDLGYADEEADAFILKAMFSTLTNVNFNALVITGMIRKASLLRDRLKDRYVELCNTKQIAMETPPEIAEWVPAGDNKHLLAQAGVESIAAMKTCAGEDVAGLRAMILYAMKGVCAYAYHAHVLGYNHPEISKGVTEILDYLGSDPTDINDLIAHVMAVGKLNLLVLENLDRANTEKFGHPEPTQVRVTPIAGKCLLVSGHDMKDLYEILEQTKNTGIHVYTHGELLPAHAYPEFKKFPHLVGNYGGAWQDQQKEFDAFPGAIVLTSNCLIEPAASYRQRLFTSGPVGWPGIKHLDTDFSPAIAVSNAMNGFTKDADNAQFITIGFGRNSVIAVADAVVGAVKSGDIKRFFLIGGCDGAASGRNYFSEAADHVPEDAVIMTLGCGKFRFNKREFGEIGGIPRLLDIGQCNDSYSALQIAGALANAFECTIHDLPLSMMISWFEQKAIAVFLTLLSLGVKNIRIGPTMPGFMTPAVLDVITSNFGVKLTGDPKTDVAAAMQGC